MEESNSSEHSEQAIALEQDTASEGRFIALYTELTGASQAQAKIVYIFSDIIRQRDPYSYRLE